MAARGGKPAGPIDGVKIDILSGAINFPASDAAFPPMGSTGRGEENSHPVIKKVFGFIGKLGVLKIYSAITAKLIPLFPISRFRKILRFRRLDPICRAGDIRR